jgi:hypothetical protein
MMTRIRVLVGMLAAGCLVVGVGAAGWRVHDREPPRMTAVRAGVVVGSFHLHSEMSHDSSTPLAAIVAAARVAGLDFVVLSDHNEQYAGPVVREGVVVLSSAELSTPFGHVIGLGARSVLSRDDRRDPAPFARIRAGGGVPVVTHPADPKQPWSGPWDGAAGLEIANFASSARRHGGRAFMGLAPLLAAGPLNRRLALDQLYDRDGTSLALWDKNPDPAFGGFCGVDAHGWLALPDNLGAWTIVLDGKLPEREADRPAWVLAALESGRFYCNAGLLGGPPGLTLEARHNDAPVARAGDSVTVDRADELVARVAGAQPGQSLVLFRNGLAVDRSERAELRVGDLSPGTYRIELWVTVPDLVWGSHIVPATYSARLRLLPASPPATAGGAP